MDHDLARRLVAACPDVCGPIPGGCGRSDNGATWLPSDLANWHSGGDGCPVPDLDDPATAGVLLARLARLCSTQTRVSVLSDAEEWEVWTIRRRFTGPTLGHACAAALVAFTTPTPPAAPGEE